MMAKRIVPNNSCGVIVDVQEFFLSQVDTRLRSRIKTNIRNFARLLGYFRVPTVVTLERPVDQKGYLPKEIEKHLSDLAETFEKDFFDLTREKRIKAEGAIFLTYKSLYYELIEAVEGGRHTEEILETFGPFPDDLPDSAAQ